MSEPVAKFLEKHQTAARLTLTAVTASVLTASTLLGYQYLTRPRLVTSKKTKASVDFLHSSPS
ncbi:unnamed protein product [Mucor hiemalis]